MCNPLDSINGIVVSQYKDETIIEALTTFLGRLKIWFLHKCEEIEDTTFGKVKKISTDFLRVCRLKTIRKCED